MATCVSCVALCVLMTSLLPVLAQSIVILPLCSSKHWHKLPRALKPPPPPPPTGTTRLTIAAPSSQRLHRPTTALREPISSLEIRRVDWRWLDMRRDSVRSLFKLKQLARWQCSKNSWCGMRAVYLLWWPVVVLAYDMLRMPRELFCSPVFNLWRRIWVVRFCATLPRGLSVSACLFCPV